MIEIRPQFIFVLLTNYSAFISSGILYVIWKWLLDWPAAWIALLLIVRATYLSILHYPKLSLKLSGTSLAGPSGAAFKPSAVELASGFTKDSTFGLTIIEDLSGNEVWYREGWYPKNEIKAFNHHLDQINKKSS